MTRVADSGCCPCHGEPWAFQGDGRTCQVKKRETHRRWKAAHRERHLAAKREAYQRRKARKGDLASAFDRLDDGIPNTLAGASATVVRGR